MVLQHLGEEHYSPVAGAGWSELRALQLVYREPAARQDVREGGFFVDLAGIRLATANLSTSDPWQRHSWHQPPQLTQARELRARRPDGSRLHALSEEVHT
jgi:hypothetical protein